MVKKLSPMSSTEIKQAYEDKAKAEHKLKQVSPDSPETPKITDDFDCTDLGNSHRFIEMHSQNVKFVGLWKSWAVWNGTNWAIIDSERDMTPLVEEMIEEIKTEGSSAFDSATREKLLRHVITSSSENKIMSTLRLASSNPLVKIKPDDFDSNPYLINFSNGTIDLRTGNLRKFNKNDMMTKICKTKFDPTATCPLWLKFLDRIFESNIDLIKYVQNILGMCLTGDASQEQIFIFWGSTGGNGKGTMVETVGTILDEYTTALPVDSLLSQNKVSIPNDIAMLKGARFVIVNEPDFGGKLNEAKIKSLTGKDTILARFLNKEFFRFKPTHHTIIQTNPQPNVDSSDGGIDRRLRLVPFNVKIPDSEVDRHLSEKLQLEASGILNWLIEGCLNWQREGLNPPKVVLDTMYEYKCDMDEMFEFFDACLIKDTRAITPHAILYTAHKLWCEIDEVPIMSKKKFTQNMRKRGYPPTGRERDQTGKLNRAFRNIRVTDPIFNLVQQILLTREPFQEFVGQMRHIVTQKKVDSHSNNYNVTDNAYMPVIPVQCVTDIHNIPDYIPVLSVRCVTDICLSKLKERYANFNIPKMNGDLKRLKDNMLLFLTNEIDENMDRDLIIQTIDGYISTRKPNLD